jgi:hypothetical protein
VLGKANYSGSGSNIYAQKYLSLLSSIAEASNNSSALPPLTEVSSSTMSLGPSQLVVGTYKLAAPSSPTSNLTARFATIRGTNARAVGLPRSEQPWPDGDHRRNPKRYQVSPSSLSGLGTHISCVLHPCDRVIPSGTDMSMLRQEDWRDAGSLRRGRPVSR